ncbi:unnamed protein product [Zymoseptoria tritici ST99CH_3D7]|uniref:Uncharacterized protein n=3 Tax=Zymoseptoria tritici TaxID=1047171 RepID=A0A1X7S8M1_ZYMT9|nr:unnamed protein product [Zymoseptoria tritici ST99CH_3D7]
MNLAACSRTRLIFPGGSLMLWGIDQKLTSTNVIPPGSIMSECFSPMWIANYLTRDTATTASNATIHVFCPQHKRFEHWRRNWSSIFKESFGTLTNQSADANSVITTEPWNLLEDSEIPPAFVTPEAKVNEEQAHVVQVARRDVIESLAHMRSETVHLCGH